MRTINRNESALPGIQLTRLMLGGDFLWLIVSIGVICYHISMLEAPTKSVVEPAKILLEIKSSRTGEESTEAMKQFLLGLVNLKKPIIPYPWYRGVTFSLEVTVIDQLIYLFGMGKAVQIGILLIAENLHSLIQIVFAPKIYLIEYTAQLLGR